MSLPFRKVSVILFRGYEMEHLYTKKCQATMFCKYIQKSSCTAPLWTSFWSVEKIHQTYFDPLLQVQVCRCSLISLETRREYDITTLQPPPPPQSCPCIDRRQHFYAEMMLEREEGRKGEECAVMLYVPGFEKERASTNSLRQRLLLSFAVFWPGEPVGYTKGVGWGVP